MDKKMTITSHTIVRNGMPFIIPVLKAVSPLMTKMFITISEKSDDGTKEAILALNDPKIEIEYELDKAIHELDSDVDGLAVNPYQLIDKENYDSSWWNKWFTKFFRNENINYRGPWPNDWIYKGDEILYWKKNPRIKKVPYRFFHLANVKPHSFRKDELTNYKYNIGQAALLDRSLPTEIGGLF